MMEPMDDMEAGKRPDGGADAEGGKAMRIDLDAVLRSRLPRGSRLVPRFVVNWLKRTICQDSLNEMLEVNRGKRGADFCRGVLDHLDIRVDVVGEENLPPADRRRVTIVSNHPLGGLDGMALIAWATERWGCDVKFIVNDLLMAIEPLSDVFVPINKHGGQSRRAIDGIDKAFEGDAPVIVFPAGLVSRMGKDGAIRDLEWQKMFVNKSARYGRDIIPIHFSGHNSSFFYKFARRRTRLGLKFNIEMIYLPREVFRNKGSRFKISIGTVIPASSLTPGAGASRQAAAIKDIVYSLSTD